MSTKTPQLGFGFEAPKPKPQTPSMFQPAKAVSTLVRAPVTAETFTKPPEDPSTNKTTSRKKEVKGPTEQGWRNGYEMMSAPGKLLPAKVLVLQLTRFNPDFPYCKVLGKKVEHIQATRYAVDAHISARAALNLPLNDPCMPLLVGRRPEPLREASDRYYLIDLDNDPCGSVALQVYQAHLQKLFPRSAEALARYRARELSWQGAEVLLPRF